MALPEGMTHVFHCPASGSVWAERVQINEIERAQGMNLIIQILSDLQDRSGGKKIPATARSVDIGEVLRLHDAKISQSTLRTFLCVSFGALA